ncbi:amino acid adenylation domain-containing protein [Flavitalea sp. BT771]|uniref:non-ribosomal peptide synthetase n=1 Tax=Flavitalea sp. BT771 TaxID=3063329 RepID=UPI0026E2C205|nr:non-ribosomal peptide synthetase [Flavitalea sp. BT771]MDO6428948.1 amino acid adenylation domain-containing protein [Flavitalea sp. BT771]MDV6218924.1 amino acid adenylation domain-containing protein [Flavitalea sp. BT771]
MEKAASSTLADVLQKIRRKGISIDCDGESLVIRTPDNEAIDEDVLADLRSHKTAIINFLKANRPVSPGAGNIITAREGMDQLPLSFAQERLWAIDHLFGSTQYHNPVVLRFEGGLDVAALKYTFRALLQRHEVLRTVIGTEDDKPHQQILSPDTLRDEQYFKELSDPAGLPEPVIKEFIAAPFDLSSDVPLRAMLIRTAVDSYLLTIVIHHIASDGWSIPLLTAEFLELYGSRCEQRPSGLKDLPVQYADYAIWQRNALKGPSAAGVLEYWRKKLSGAQRLDLPTDYPRPSTLSTSGSEIRFVIDAATADGLMRLAHRENATLYMTLLSALNVLLHRYSGQKDISIGTPVAGRTHPDVEGLIGFFVNTLVIRTDLDDNPSFTVLLQRVKDGVLEAFSHQEAPFEKVVESLNIEKTLDSNPLFDVLFSLQDMPQLPDTLPGGLKATPVVIKQSTAKFDIIFNVFRTKEELLLSIEYCTDLFNEDTIRRMGGHFCNLLGSIVGQDDQRIGDIFILSEEETNRLSEFAGASVPGGDGTIIDLIAAQSARTPSAEAMRFEDLSLSYEELEERSNRLGHYLRELGVGPEQLVGICIERSMEMVIGILGIMKAGGAYVPIDPEYPLERIEFMLEDTGAAVVLSSRESRGALPKGYGGRVVLVGEVGEGYATERPRSGLRPEHLAYVIYTSGSTGRPKGVMVEHRNVVQLFDAANLLYDFNKEDVWALFHSFCFDFSVWEMYGALLYGGRLVIVEKEVTRDAERFGALLAREAVTVLNQTPSAFYALQEQMASHPQALAVRYVIFGGEALDLGRVTQWKGLYPGCKLINMYGITETTVHVTYQEIGEEEMKRGGSIIGRAIPTLRVYLLDDSGHPAPLGFVGELYIGGAGVSRGYLKRPELMAERFVEDRFGDAGGRLYRSGDLGRWLPDGTIEYLGRKDEQVKIRGFRVELGEVERMLGSCKGVSQCAVVLREEGNGSHKTLAGYVVMEEDLDREAISVYLRRRLPEYMVPGIVVRLPELPLTGSGKVDRKALSRLEVGRVASSEYAAAEGELELLLSGVWSEVLGRSPIGREDNFFELGGDSIITIQVVSRCRRLGLELHPRDLFLYQTIRSLAMYLRERKEVYRGEAGLLEGASGLLPIQERFFRKGYKDPNHYNQAILLEIVKGVKGEWVEESLRLLAMHHDALRFRYEQQASGGWVQRYGKEAVFGWREEDVPKGMGLPEAGDWISGACDACQRGLSLEEGRLLQGLLLRTGPEMSHDRLLLVIHHLAVDGVSWRILLEDLDRLLEGRSRGEVTDLGRKSSSYRQWYKMLEQYGEEVEAERKYWEEQAAGPRRMKVDKEEEGSVQSDVRVAVMRLDRRQTRRLLQETNQAYHTEINDILLSGLWEALQEWGGTGEWLIGLEGHGREDWRGEVDLSRTVGWFTTLYPVILGVEGSGPGDVIRSVKERLRRVPHKGLGYGVLRYLRDGNRMNADEYDVVFNYLGQVDNAVSGSRWLRGAGEHVGAVERAENPFEGKFSITASVVGEELVVWWNYSSRQYEEETVKQLAEGYMEKLRVLIDHCGQQRETVYTPSDFGLGHAVGNHELSRFLEGRTWRGELRREVLREQSIYGLSGLQEGILFHGIYDKHSSAYALQFSCALGEVDVDLFRRSWELLLARHSILRSGFHYAELSVPVQCVYRDVELPFEVLDYRKLSAAEQAAALELFIKEEYGRGFDFHRPPLMRVTVIRLGGSRHQLVWSIHHILVDGWSMPVLMGELLDNYERLWEGREVKGGAEDNYGDYIRFIRGRDEREERKFWQGYLKGLEQGTLLPFADGRGERNKGIGEYGYQELVLEEDLTDRIREFGQRHHVTVNTIMQGVWAFLLGRYSGDEAVVYGVTVSGRPGELAGSENRVGLYINTIPLYVRLEEEMTVLAWLRRLQEEHTAAREYQYTPLARIQGWQGITGDLFDSVLLFENYPMGEVLARKNTLEIEDLRLKDHSNYLLTLTISKDKQFRIGFNYNGSLLPGAYIGLIKGHFDHIVHAFIDHPDMLLEKISLMTDEERLQTEALTNRSVSSPCLTKTIHELFDEQAARTPAATAIVHETFAMSYERMHAKSHSLAGYLMDSCQVRKGDIIAIALESSPALPISIMAVLKAGGIVLPLETSLPAGRISALIRDSKAGLLITNNKEFATLTDKVVFFRQQEEAIDEHRQNGSLPVCSPADVAYLIFTSGSTGKPKAVKLTHLNLVNQLQWFKEYFNMGPKDVFPQKTVINFVDSICELLFPVTLGASSIYLRPYNEIINDSRALSAWLTGIGATILQFVPSVFEHFAETTAIDALTSLRCLILSGEELKRHYKYDFEIHNIYGCSECSASSTVYRLDHRDDGKIPIGRPIDHTSIYIYNEKMEQVPPYMKGDIYIGGLGVCAGYLNDDDLTRQKLVPRKDGNGELIYKTGDIGSWLPDGAVLYWGRKDHMVKIRGVRVELQEIEASLTRIEGIDKAVVTGLYGSDTLASQVEILAAFTGPSSIPSKEIYEKLKTTLPPYMIPNRLLYLEKIPLNSSGKVDKKKILELAAAAGNDAAGMDQGPQNLLQQRLAEIWKAILKKSEIGINTNFFEAGGHSLTATRMVLRLQKDMQVEVELQELFNNPTIRELSDLIEKKGMSGFEGIPVAEKQEAYALSHAQRRLWIMDQLSGNNAAYNMAGGYRLTGRLDSKAFAAAYMELIRRHEILRTSFLYMDNGPMQKIHHPDDALFALRSIDLRQAEDVTSAARTVAEQEFNFVFDLQKVPLIRATLLHTREDEYVFLFVTHHIISDRWSLDLLTREIAAIYGAFVSGRPHTLPELRIHYKDFSFWQNEELRKSRYDDHRAYWLGMFQGPIPELDLPVARQRPDKKNYNGDSVGFIVGGATGYRLAEVGKQQQASLFMTLLASVNAFIYCYTGERDIVIGTPVSGRTVKDLEDQVGFYVNTLALRNKFNGEDSFEKLLQTVRHTTLLAYEHQDYPYDKLVEELNLTRNPSRQALFDVQVTLQNAGSLYDIPEMPGVRLDRFGDPAKTSRFDLVFNFIETMEGLNLSIDYDSDLFLKKDVERMGLHLIRMLEIIAGDSNVVLKDIEYIRPEEKLSLLGLNKVRHFGQGATVLDLFAAQVARDPGAAAARFEGKALSYGALEEQSNRLGHYLVGRGVQKGELVGLCVERGFEMIIGILGIMKAGGAYVPVDPSYPAERIRYMLSDSGARYVLSQGMLWYVLDGINFAEVIWLNDTADMEACSGAHVPVEVNGSDLAYVIYTSGSTGHPKGVMIEHGGLVNLVHNQVEDFHLRPGTRMLQFASPSFDASCSEIFTALSSGSCLILPAAGDILSAESLKACIAEYGIGIATLPPSYQQVFKEDTLALTTIVSAGEPLNVKIANNFQSRGIHVINAYGPTENTVCISLSKTPVLQDGTVTIGRPLNNVSVYILDQRGQLAPEGVVGELCVGGVQVARGYWNRPDLTAAQFVPDPFRGGRMYRTGDQARWLAGGNLEYLGRRDEQVKIRGHRVELGEIERALANCAGVLQCAVVTREDEAMNHKVLVGYVVLEVELEVEGLQEILRRELPEYMVPGILVRLAELPLTGSGKVDRKALSSQDLVRSERKAYVGAQDELEELLVGVWEEILGRSPIGREDNFFELGGDSIITIQVVSRCRREGIAFHPQDIFRWQTIGALSAYLRERKGMEEGETGQLEGISGLLPIQARFFRKEYKYRGHYNQAVLLDVEKGIRGEWIRESLLELVLHHDALRFRYVQGASGAWEQHYGREAVFGWCEQAIPEGMGSRETGDWISGTCDAYQRELSLEEGRLLQGLLLRTGPGMSHDRLLLVIHHLAVDGVSWRILLEDLDRLLDGRSRGEKVALGKKGSSYRQWYNVLEEYKAEVEMERGYWQEQERGRRQLQVDQEWEGSTLGDTKVVTRHLDREQTRLLLQETNQAYHTEINDILLSGLWGALRTWGGEEEWLVGLEGHGREDWGGQADISRTVGWFTSLYPVLLGVEGSGAGDVIQSVKERLRRVPRKGLGYGVLRYMLDEGRQGVDEYEIVFNYLGQLDNAVRGSRWFRGASEWAGRPQREEEGYEGKLSITASVVGEELVVWWNYSGRQYEQRTIEGLAELYMDQLRMLIDHCCRRKGGVHTPSDYGLGHAVSHRELSRFLEGEEEDMDDILII